MNLAHLLQILSIPHYEFIVPSKWKQTNYVNPLPKTSPPSKLRPISLTSNLAKIAEGRVAKFIVDSIQDQEEVRQW